MQMRFMLIVGERTVLCAPQVCYVSQMDPYLVLATQKELPPALAVHALHQ
jgi:hypothetical protein